jgi:phosphoglycolate phosphatase
VWDLDGTLIDSAPDLAQALNTLLREHDHAELEVSRVRTMIGDGVTRLVERGFAAAGRRVRGRQLLHLVRRFTKIYAACATDKTRLYTGARQVLRHFSDAGMRQGICTNKPESITRQILSKFSIADHFGAVIGGDSTIAKKPDALPLRSCLDALNASPRQSVLIGDSGVDVAAARAASVPVGIVTFGYAWNAATVLGADFLVDHLYSLPTSISELGNVG